MVRVGRFLLVLLFAAALLTSSQNGPKTEIAQAQTDPVEIYSCDQLLGKIQTVSNGAAVIEAIDNCTIVNNKIRAVIRFKTETCAIFNQLPYCRNSPNDAWINYVQTNGRNAIAGILKNPEPTGLYMRKCQNTEYDPWPPGDSITWTCKRDRSVNQQQTSQTITDRAWLTISPKPKITIAADETSVSWGEPFFNLTWESQFAETVYLEMSTDGDNWQQYQGYGFQLTPPGGGNQSVNGGQQGGNASDFVHRFFRTKASNTYNQGQSQNSPPGYSNLLDIIIGPIAVSLKATPSGILAGQSSVLSWKSRGASTLTIDNGIGGVAVPSGSKVVTPPQTTTYVITAKGQTGVMATASAQVTLALPDLAPDLSNLSVTVDGTVASKALVSRFTNSVVLSGIKIKNVGSGDTTATSGEVGIKIETSGGHNYFYKTGFNVPAIRAGGEITIPPADLASVLNKWRDEVMPWLTGTISQNTSDLRVVVNAKKQLQEVSFDNNSAVKDQYFQWPALKVTTRSKSSDILLVSIEGNQGKFITNSISTSYSRDPSGYWVQIATFPVLPVPGQPGEYVLRVMRDDDFTTAKDLVKISDYSIQTAEIIFEPPPSLILRPAPLVPNVSDNSSADPNDPHTLTELFGYAITGNVTVEIIGSNVTNGAVEVPIGYYGERPGVKIADWVEGSKAEITGVNATLTIKDTLGKNQQIDFVDDNISQAIVYKADDIRSYGQQFEDFSFSLEPDCSTVTNNGLIKICIYDDPHNIQKAKSTWLPEVKNSMERLSSLPDPYKLTSVKEFWAIATYLTGGGTFVVTKTQPYIYFNSRLLYLSNYFAMEGSLHEGMHAIDYQLSSKSGPLSTFSSENPTFLQSFEFSRNDNSHWKTLGWACAYKPGGVDCIGHPEQDNEMEVWAEQMTVACTNPNEMKKRVAAVYGNSQQIPGDSLVAIASRSIGDPLIGAGNVVFGGAAGHYQYAAVSQIVELISACAKSLPK